MNLFAEYLQPLTLWLETYPYWALFFTFIISLTESLAIIGSIIPGSVTMTAIGILAGSGVMRVDLTLLAAILGAVGGDSLSYAIGYYYSDRLVDIWPFKKYPNWLKYGKDFFENHGGKSVLIGRFIGPLRSIIPVVAGIMHMRQLHFISANVISAIGWALLYILPGILIGAASHELSAESATRLFIMILCLLGVLWLLTAVVKWLLLKLHGFLKANLHHFWVKIQYKPVFNILYKHLTPLSERNHYTTVVLLLFTLFASLASVIFCLNSKELFGLNLPIHLFIQSFRTYMLEGLFIFLTQLTSTLTLISLFIFCYLWLLKQKRFKEIVYLVSLMGSCALVYYVLTYAITTPRPPGLLVTLKTSSFPSQHLLYGTAFYSFIIFYLSNNATLFSRVLKTLLLASLILTGLASIYLGDHWLSDELGSYSIGATLSLIHYLFYRKSSISILNNVVSNTFFILSFIIVLILSSSLSAYVNFKTILRNHAPYYQQFTLDKANWWGQQEPILPIYYVNRIGKKISLLNIQYLGDVDLLQNSLAANGWKTHSETFFTKLLMRVDDKGKEIKLPLLTQLYENRRPELVMTYKDNQLNIFLEFTLWRSNYNVNDVTNPIWVGTVHLHKPSSASETDIDEPNYISSALQQFALKKVSLSQISVDTTMFPAWPYILLIKAPD